MIAIENLIVQAQKNEQPYDRIVVVGDVNSTMAATIAAAKMNVPVAHVEAGLRSFDRRMPEEINRMVTDSIADLLLCSEPVGVENLLREGHRADRVHLVGNVMIDTLRSQVERAQSQDTLTRHGLTAQQYAVVTLHRPSNVDDRDTLAALLDVLVEASAQIPIVFPVHPRTRARMEDFGLLGKVQGIASFNLLEPLGYLDFLCLTSQSKVIITDSGGLQEESTALEIPCLTMRENTERPITCTEGTGILIGNSSALLRENLELVLSGNYPMGSCPELWDGKAAQRIATVLHECTEAPPHQSFGETT